MDSLFKKIFENEKKLLDPKNYLDEITELLADDFIEIGSSGHVYYRNDVIFQLSNLNIQEIKILNFEAKLVEKNIVLVLYKAEKKISNSNVTQISFRSSLWKRVKGTWKIIFHQGTLET
ncbi:DUF4440 domain-containing protein [Coxiella burnetii]|uniref:DUF4440 domain-containing protein n=1 Tax=Coxiella burnetii (strain RSA 493 / Nine Mile phase I) TaxID=227377 RepID=Q83CT5_COXBU|nr:DUF4440 domain-containing protein [Coxiella burnetii]NP_820024.1 hypothetical protein CBU_1018 [Coxiella burnetii RSA 493]AAO90538.1 hypothetical protein CBU_1018 [Coxiella burnetii RSA 493]ARI65840.1 DUF4440 domain-containing protein [Coxiella burnetii]ARK27310.1 DUF4440 domain-containing protein [Coxiella burnetii]MCF2092762.1 DUF4440 domain-containing protein [Coxiella burnetii]MCF2095042.1 DUF4440 domain-containing protein [Coxiella burnetii]